MSIRNLLLSKDFSVNGVQIFDNCIQPSLCKVIFNKVLSIEPFAKKINADGILMNSLNGEFLIKQIPEIKLIHDEVYEILKAQIINLLSLDDLAVGISTNILRAEEGHSFRLHFDRHEYTVIAYLSENNNFPIKIFPNIRNDPRTNDSQWLYDQYKICPLTIYPEVGKVIVFKGRTCLHAVELVGEKIKGLERISLQFGFDTKFKDFYSEKYYGRSPRDSE